MYSPDLAIVTPIFPETDIVRSPSGRGRCSFHSLPARPRTRLQADVAEGTSGLRDTAEAATSPRTPAKASRCPCGWTGVLCGVFNVLTPIASQSPNLKERE